MRNRNLKFWGILGAGIIAILKSNSNNKLKKANNELANRKLDLKERQMRLKEIEVFNKNEEVYWDNEREVIDIEEVSAPEEFDLKENEDKLNTLF